MSPLGITCYNTVCIERRLLILVRNSEIYTMHQSDSLYSNSFRSCGAFSETPLSAVAGRRLFEHEGMRKTSRFFRSSPG